MLRFIRLTMTDTTSWTNLHLIRFIRRITEQNSSELNATYETGLLWKLDERMPEIDLPKAKD